MRNELVTIETQYKSGTEILRKKKEGVFAEKKSVNRTEFYTAYRSGLGVKYVFDLDPDDYNSCIEIVKNEDGMAEEYLPSHIIFDDVEYIIIRAYQTSSNSIEVTVR